MDHSILTSGNASSAGVGSADSRSKINGAGEHAQEMMDRLFSTAHQTVDKLANGTTRVVDKLADQRQWISQAPPRALASSRSWVQDKPLETVGIALAVGYIAGRLLRR